MGGPLTRGQAPEGAGSPARGVEAALEAVAGSPARVPDPEESFFLDPDGSARPVFVVWHRGSASPVPDTPGPRLRGTAVVLFAPFGPEKVKAHRTLVAFARYLAALGADVFRFDHRGQGDSGGDFSSTGFQDLVADGVAVLSAARELAAPRRVAAVGLRLGATLAAQAAALGAAAVDALVLWSPVADAHAFLYEALRANLADQTLLFGRVERDRARLLADMARGEPVEVDGFPFTHRLFEEARGYTLDAALGAFRGPSLVLDLCRGGGRPEAPSLPSGGGGEVPPARVPDPSRSERFSGTVEVASPFWVSFVYHRPREEDLFARTARFLAGEAGPQADSLQEDRPGGPGRVPEALARSLRLVDGASERPLALAGGRGSVLRGILHEVPGGRGRGVVLLNSGLLPRYGYHRHYVKLARRLAGRGFQVLRLDCTGLGDSGGELPEGPVRARWQDIQKGLLVPDARAAAAFCRENLGWREVTVAGACGGAVTALLAAAAHPREFDRVLAIAVPLLLSDATGPASTLREFEARRLLSAYGRKLLSPAACLRFLCGRSDYRTLLRALGKAGLERGRRLLGWPPWAAARTPPAWNADLARALLDLARSDRPTLVVLAALDPETDDFLRYAPAPLRGGRGNYRLTVVEGANHTFSVPAAEEELFRRITDWMEAGAP